MNFVNHLVRYLLSSEGQKAGLANIFKPRKYLLYELLFSQWVSRESWDKIISFTKMRNSISITFLEGSYFHFVITDPGLDIHLLY